MEVPNDHDVTPTPAATDPASLQAQVVFRDAEVLVQDAASGVSLTFTPAEWRAFLAGVKSGEFDVLISRSSDT